MKNKIFQSDLLLAGFISLSLSYVQPLAAQTPPNPDASQNSKNFESTADRHSSTTGSGTTESSSLDKTNSKDIANSLDKNPSIGATDSADKSATKDPNGGPELSKLGGESVSTEGKSSHLSDKDFLLAAAQGGMTEVELGKIAEEKAASTSVKKFGSRMVKDHSQANEKLKVVAQKENVTLPETLDPEHQAMVDQFKNLTGAKFDYAYVHMMVKDHKKDVNEFREESADAQNDDVKNFAGETLKIIESHLSEIKSIQAKLK